MWYDKKLHRVCFTSIALLIIAEVIMVRKYNSTYEKGVNTCIPNKKETILQFTHLSYFLSFW